MQPTEQSLAAMLLGQQLVSQSVAYFAQMLLWGFVSFLFFIFPDGRFVPGWTRWFAWARALPHR